MVHRLGGLLLLVLVFQEEPPPEPAVDRGRQVVILVNENVPESVSIGEYYATRRGIPKDNICRIRTTSHEICEWAELRKDILEPLKKFLEGKPDILYIVPTWGVPVKTKEENPANDGKDGPPGPIGAAVTGRDFCCIDREIELLNVEHKIEGWLESTVFRAEKRLTREDKIFIVSRLDGPTAEAARGLVDLALYGEAYGIEGRSLLDTRGMTGTLGHAGIDSEMREIAPVFEKYGIEFDHDDKPDVVDLATRTAQGHYWGWYTGNIVASKATFRFVPGAVGAHLHSFSAMQLRRDNQTWTGPLVHHGITGTCGTVYEPLSPGFPYGHIFFARFLDGYTFGEAMTIATMYTSWMAVYVGDPLYAPYAAGAKERQAKNRETAKTAFKAIAAALDAGDAGKAVALAKDVEAIGVPYAGSDDTSFLVREAKARLAFPDRKSKGTVEELRQAMAAAASATDPKQGAALARKAVDLSPASADANLLLARWSVEAGAGREALDAAEIVEKSAPGYDASYWKGRAFLLLKKPKEALAAFDAALAVKVDLRAIRGAGEALVDLKRYKEAIARLEDVVKRHPGEREIAVELGRAYAATKEWKRAVEVLDAALQDLPTVWDELKPWAECADALAAALRAEGIEKERPKELAQAVRDIQVGRLKPTPPAVAAKVGAAIDEAAAGGDKKGELPFYDERSSGFPKVRMGNRSPGDLQIHLSGPVSHSFSFKPFTGRDVKPTELELVPGVYRIAVVITEKGATPKKLHGLLKLGPGQIYAIAIDATHKYYKP